MIKNRSLYGNFDQKWILNKKHQDTKIKGINCKAKREAHTSKRARVNDKIGMSVVALQITQKSFWQDEKKLYESVLPEYKNLKEQFTQSITKLLQSDNKAYRKDFDIVVKNIIKL